MLLNTSWTAELENPSGQTFSPKTVRLHFCLCPFRHWQTRNGHVCLHGQRRHRSVSRLPALNPSLSTLLFPTHARTHTKKQQEGSSRRPQLHRTPISHLDLVGAEYKWTLHFGWSAAGAAGMRVDGVNSGRSVRGVRL